MLPLPHLSLRSNRDCILKLGDLEAAHPTFVHTYVSAQGGLCVLGGSLERCRGKWLTDQIWSYSVAGHHV